VDSLADFVLKLIVAFVFDFDVYRPDCSGSFEIERSSVSLSHPPHWTI
jgi:hypothetical protein